MLVMSFPVAGFRLPVRANLEQLRHQAMELWRAIHERDPAALAQIERFCPDNPGARTKLADAQLMLARAYRARAGFSSSNPASR